MKRPQALLIVIALVVVTVLCAPLHRASADIPVATATGNLANAGDTVQIQGLIGQSSCVFSATGTPGAIDAEGSNDGTNWTALTITDYAVPPNVESQPYAPTAGYAYIINPTSLARVRIRADSTWSGSAAVTIRCTGAVALNRLGSGGSGTTYQAGKNISITTGKTNTIAVVPSPAFAGGIGTNNASPQPGYDVTCGANGTGNCKIVSGKSVNVFTQNLANTACNFPTSFYDIMQWEAPSPSPTSTPLAVAEMRCDGGLQISGPIAAGYGMSALPCPYGDGCFGLSQSSGAIVLGGDISSCTLDFNVTHATYLTSSCPIYNGGAPTYTPGPNVTFSPGPTGSPTAISIASVPVLAGVEFTPAPDYSPGTLAGFATAGDGNAKLVSVSVSPCPTAGGCVVSVSGSGGTTCTGTAIVNCSTQTPNPTCTGAVSCTGTLFGGNLVISANAPTPAPTAYPTPVVTGSPPITVSATTSAGQTTYAASLGIVPPSLGGLGASAASYANGQCPTYSSSLGYFVGSACSSGGGNTVYAGSNVVVTPTSSPGVVVSVTAAPTFSGKVNAAGFQATSGSSSIGVNTTYGLSPVFQFGIGSYANTFGAGCSTLSTPAGICFTTIEGGSANGISYTNTIVFRETYESDETTQCTMYFGAGAYAGWNYACPILAQNFRDAGLSSTSAPVCGASTTNLSSCGVAPVEARGTVSCTLSSNACTSTVTVPSGTQGCSITQTGTDPAPSVATKFLESVSGTTATLQATYLGTATGTVSMYYVCS